MKELQNLSKQIEIHNFIYRHKANNDLKTFIGFNVPLGFYKNIKEGYIIWEKAEEEQKSLNRK